jgi:hypothetical protein
VGDGEQDRQFELPETLVAAGHVVIYTTTQDKCTTKTLEFGIQGFRDSEIRRFRVRNALESLNPESLNL